MDVRIDAIDIATRSVTLTLLPSGPTRTIKGVGADTKIELIEYLRNVIKTTKTPTFMADAIVGDILSLDIVPPVEQPQKVEVISSNVNPVIVKQAI